MAAETTKTVTLNIETNAGVSATEVSRLTKELEKTGASLASLNSYAKEGDSALAAFDNTITIQARDLSDLAQAIARVKTALGVAKVGFEELAQTEEMWLQGGQQKYSEHHVSDVKRQQREILAAIKAESKEELELLKVLQAEEARVVFNGAENKTAIQQEYKNRVLAIFTDLKQKVRAIESGVTGQPDAEAAARDAKAKKDRALIEAQARLQEAQAYSQASLDEYNTHKTRLNNAVAAMRATSSAYAREVNEEIKTAKFGADSIRAIEVKRDNDIAAIRAQTARRLQVLETTARGVGDTGGSYGMFSSVSSHIQEEAIKAERAIAAVAQAEIEAKKAHDEGLKKRIDEFAKYSRTMEQKQTALFNVEKAIAKHGEDSIYAIEAKAKQELLDIDARYYQRKEALGLDYYNEAISRQKAVAELNLLGSTRTTESKKAYEPLREAREKEEALDKLTRYYKTTSSEQVRIMEEQVARELAVLRHGEESKEVRLRDLSNKEAAIKRNLAVQLANIDSEIRNNTVHSAEEVNKRIKAVTQQAGVELKKVAADIAQVEPDSKRINAYNMSLMQAISHYSRVYVLMTGIHEVSQKINQVLHDIPKAGIELESAYASLSASLEGGPTEATQQLQELKVEARRTGIPLTELTANFRNLTASTLLTGESLETTWKIFKNMNTAMVTLHQSGDQTSHTFLALTQMFNKGKIQSEELVRQLANYIPGAFASFATATGRTTAQLAIDMKKGLVATHGEILKFSEFLATRFGGEAFNEARRGLNAAIGTYQTSITTLEQTVYNKISHTLKTLLEKITSFTDKLNESVESTDSFARAIGGLSGAVNSLGIALSSVAIVTFLNTLSKLNPWVAIATTVASGFVAVNSAAESSTTSIKALSDSLKTLAVPTDEAAKSTFDYAKNLQEIEGDLKSVYSRLKDVEVFYAEGGLDPTKYLKKFTIGLDAAALRKELEAAGDTIKVGMESFKVSEILVDKNDPDAEIKTYKNYLQKVMMAVLKERKARLEELKQRPELNQEKPALYTQLGLDEQTSAGIQRQSKKELDRLKKSLDDQLSVFESEQKAKIAEIKKKTADITSGMSPQEGMKLELEAIQAIAAMRERNNKILEDEIIKLREKNSLLDVNLRKNQELQGINIPDALRQTESSMTHAKDFREQTLRAMYNKPEKGELVIGPGQIKESAFIETRAIKNTTAEKEASVARYKELADQMLAISKKTAKELTQADVDAIAELDTARNIYWDKMLRDNQNNVRIALAYYKGMGKQVQGILEDIHARQGKLTEEQQQEVYSRLNVESKSLIENTIKLALKKQQATKTELGDLELQSEQEAALLDTEEARNIAKKEAADIERMITAQMQERAKAADSVYYKVQSFYDQMAQRPERLRDQWEKATKDIDFAIKVLDDQHTAEATKHANELRQWKIDGKELVQIKDDEVAAQRKLNMEMTKIDYRQDILQAKQSVGAITEWDALKAQQDINRDRMAELRATLDQQRQDIVSREKLGETATPDQWKAFEQTRHEMEKLAITGDVIGNKIKMTLQSALGNAFSDFITGAADAQTAMRNFATSVLKSVGDIMANKMAEMLISSAFNFIMPGNGSFFGGLLNFGSSTSVKAIAPAPTGNTFMGGSPSPWKDGGVFNDGIVQKFAVGGIVHSPTRFPLRGGRGLMGEAGPEAIIPLRRGKDGKLGVAGGSNTTINNTHNIAVTIEKYTGKDDPEAMATKIAEAISRKVSREEIARANRKGNVLNPIGAF